MLFVFSSSWLLFYWLLQSSSFSWVGCCTRYKSSPHGLTFTFDILQRQPSLGSLPRCRLLLSTCKSLLLVNKNVIWEIYLLFCFYAFIYFCIFTFFNSLFVIPDFSISFCISVSLSANFGGWKETQSTAGLVVRSTIGTAQKQSIPIKFTSILAPWWTKTSIIPPRPDFCFSKASVNSPCWWVIWAPLSAVGIWTLLKRKTGLTFRP